MLVPKNSDIKVFIPFFGFQSCLDEAVFEFNKTLDFL